jgi:hypothetical protein
MEKDRGMPSILAFYVSKKGVFRFSCRLGDYHGAFVYFHYGFLR